MIEIGCSLIRAPLRSDGLNNNVRIAAANAFTRLIQV
jgi:hypothetical protein